jgi:hypothetical protein
MLTGDVDASWLTGENHQIVPTETQKNTCYALALQTVGTSPSLSCSAPPLATQSCGGPVLLRSLHWTVTALGRTGGGRRTHRTNIQRLL